MSKPEEALPMTDPSREERAVAPVNTEETENASAIPEPADAQDIAVNLDDAHEAEADTEVSNYADNGDVAEGDAAADNANDDTDKRPVRYAIVGLAVGILVGFCFNFAVTGVQEIIRSSTATAISVAVTDCNLNGRDGVSVSDGNKHLIIDTKGSADTSGASTQNAVCLVHALQVPDNVLAKLNDTQPDGKIHKEEWDQREITWEFSRDKGIKIDFLIKS